MSENINVFTTDLIHVHISPMLMLCIDKRSQSVNKPKYQSALLPMNGKMGTIKN